MKKINFQPVEMSQRIPKLIHTVFEKKPCIESERALLLTESYKMNEDQPMVLKRAKALKHILDNMTIVIRDEELFVGNSTVQPHAAQVFPEFSIEWLRLEFDTIADRSADPFDISDQVKADLESIIPYWKGKTVSELALSLMAPETRQAMDRLFDVGSYCFFGCGMVSVDYEDIMKNGLERVINQAEEARKTIDITDPDSFRKQSFLDAVIIVNQAVIDFAHRFAKLAEKMAAETQGRRKEELLKIAENCYQVPGKPARDFYEACQSMWFVQLVVQIEGNGHSISPLRFDQFAYPWYKADLESGKLTRESAQELLDALWVKFNEINKVRALGGALAFGGYPMFQNINVGGQDAEGHDAANELSFACIEATEHTRLPQPSLAARVFSGSTDEYLLKCAECARLGMGFPAYYNDEVIVPALMNRGMSLEDARDYGIVGCVEPSKSGKTDGWHGGAFFNMVKVLELALSNGKDEGVQLGLKTGEPESFATFDQLYKAYEEQMEYAVRLLANAENAIDKAHSQRGLLPFLSSHVEDCLGRCLCSQEGGAIYSYTAPQGVGVANIADSLETLKELVYEQKLYTIKDFTDAMAHNFEGPQYQQMLARINSCKKYGNDIPEVDLLARKVANNYCEEVARYKNVRGGIFEPGLYPVSANVPMGLVVGAMPDGRKAGTPLADGISPVSGRDVNGPTAVINSVAVLDQAKASNGTLLNQKFTPSSLAGRGGLERLNALIRGYFDQKGMHIQFNVIDRETLLNAQKDPDHYKNLVVRVAGYSAHFVNLDKSIQDDIINRTEQSFS